MTLFRYLRRFARKDDGTGAIELLLVVPMMTWVFLGTIVYFDAYRDRAITQRASLTVADMYSRETDYITPAYLNGTRDLLKFLMSDDETTKFRVTAFTWRDSDTRYHRIWSRNRGGLQNYNNERLALVAERLPILDNGEVAILVETERTYKPPFDVGIGDTVVSTFTLTSPRFATKLCWNSTPEDGTSTEIC